MTYNFLSEDTLVFWLQRLVRFPSEQTALQENDPNIKAFIKKCVAPLLKELNLGPCQYDEMGNLILQLGKNKSEKSILFLTYAMTHPAATMEDPFNATIIKTSAGPAIRGRGVAEQKTAMAAAIAAVAQTATEGISGQLIFAAVSAGETGRHDAVKSVLSNLKNKPDFAIICLGTDGKIASGNKGRLDVDVTVRGKATHSSMPWKGIDAIAGAQHCLKILKGLKLGASKNASFTPATLTPTSIHSEPDATHTLQDTVKMTFDRRLLPGEDPDKAFNNIKKALKDTKPWSIECVKGNHMYPNEVQEDGALLPLIKKSYDDANVEQKDPIICDFALDAGYFGNLGIEAVMLGPGQIDQFHSSEESVLIRDMVDIANIYHRLMTNVLL